MKQFNLVNATLAGLIGTAAMTVMMILAPMMGMPEMNIGSMLAGFMGIPVALGWAAHFMIGAVLAVIYALMFAQRFAGSVWVRGMLFSLIPWLMAQVLVNPMMGAGLFAANTPAPLAIVMGSLMGHLVYGAVIGGVYGWRSGAVTAQHI